MELIAVRRWAESMVVDEPARSINRKKYFIKKMLTQGDKEGSVPPALSLVFTKIVSL